MYYIAEVELLIIYLIYTKLYLWKSENGDLHIYWVELAFKTAVEDTY